MTKKKTNVSEARREYEKAYYKKNKKRIQKYRKKNKLKIKKQRKEFYEKNKDRLLSKYKSYRKDNALKLKKKRKEYYEKNKKRLLAEKRDYYKKNTEKLKLRSRINAAKQSTKDKRKETNKKNINKLRKQRKAYVKKNINRINLLRRKRYKKKYENDPYYKTVYLIKNRFQELIAEGKIKKKFAPSLTKFSKEVLDIDPKGLMSHIEKKWHPHPKTGKMMSWKNHSLKGWHIDHIKPINKFDLSKPSELKRCFNYKNLQPLWAEVNVRKKDFYSE